MGGGARCSLRRADIARIASDALRAVLCFGGRYCLAPKRNTSRFLVQYYYSTAFTIYPCSDC